MEETMDRKMAMMHRYKRAGELTCERKFQKRINFFQAPRAHHY